MHLTSRKVVEEYKMICHWLANQECLFPGEFSIRIHVFRVRTEKKSNVHSEDKRIREEISPITKASPAKLSNIDCTYHYQIPQVQQNDTISIYMYIYIYIYVRVAFNKFLDFFVQTFKIVVDS